MDSLIKRANRNWIESILVFIELSLILIVGVLTHRIIDVIVDTDDIQLRIVRRLSSEGELRAERLLGVRR